jgi:putative cell wall-binding protein
MVGGVALVAATAGPAQAEATTDRVAGDDRFATAAELAAQADGDPDRVWLATGSSFADALAAGAAGEPVLLTAGHRLPAVTADALARLSPSSLVVAGGPQVLSDQVAAQAGQAAGAAPQRAAGTNRFGTAAAVTRRTHPDGADTVWLATGGGFADALAAGPVAATGDAPLLLAADQRLPEPTAAALSRLDPDRVVVVGGSSAVSDTVAHAVAETATANVTRLAGNGRFATAAAVADYFEESHGTASTAYLATGTGFADALAAGPAAAADRAPLLLATVDKLPTPTRQALADRGDELVRVVGGPVALSDRVAEYAAHPTQPPGVCDPYDATEAGVIQGHPEDQRPSLDAWTGPWMVDHFRTGWQLAVPYRWRFDVVNEEGHGGVLFYEDSRAEGGDRYAHRYALTVFCGNPFQVGGGRALGYDTAEVAEFGPHRVNGTPDVERTDRPGLVYSAEFHDLGNADPADDRVKRYDYVTVGSDVILLVYEMENAFAREHAGQAGAIADAVTASVGAYGTVGCPPNAGSCRSDRDRTQGGTPP